MGTEALGYLPRRIVFEHKTAELAEMDYILKFDSVAEGPAGGNHWILELNASNVHAEIWS